MTHQELFDECAKSGALPAVKTSVPVKYATGDVGRVTTIKPNGIGVLFPGLNYESWFWKDREPDKRKKYMEDLTINLRNE